MLQEFERGGGGIGATLDDEMKVANCKKEAMLRLWSLNSQETFFSFLSLLFKGSGF